MAVLNMHERAFKATREQVAALIASLSSPADLLWPGSCWPRMRFDRRLSVGAAGGHGPIRYFVEAYAPGESIRFRFTGPAGFDGYHAYEMHPQNESVILLRHVLKMETHSLARVSWPLVYRPLHDALIEDSFATAEVSLGQSPRIRRWSAWVRFLRWAVSFGRAAKQSRLTWRTNPASTAGAPTPSPQS